jgi:hypothetical protein
MEGSNYPVETTEAEQSLLETTFIMERKEGKYPGFCLFSNLLPIISTSQTHQEVRKERSLGNGIVVYTQQSRKRQMGKRPARVKGSGNDRLPDATCKYNKGLEMPRAFRNKQKVGDLDKSNWNGAVSAST